MRLQVFPITGAANVWRPIAVCKEARPKKAGLQFLLGWVFLVALLCMLPNFPFFVICLHYTTARFPRLIQTFSVQGQHVHQALHRRGMPFLLTMPVFELFHCSKLKTVKLLGYRLTHQCNFCSPTNQVQEGLGHLI